MKFLTLILRELWEHTGIWRVPLVALILAILANVAFSGAIDKASMAPGVVAKGLIGGSVGIVSAVLFILFTLLAMLYLLDSLHGERKDKSILFWRSLPVSDLLTVLAKLAVAVVIIPVLLLLTLVLVQLISTAVHWVLSGGESSRLIDAVGAPENMLSSWITLGGIFLRLTIWTLPLLAWFLFCSSWVSRTPIIMAIGIPFVIGLLSRIVSPEFSLFGLFTERWPFSATVLKSFGVVAFKEVESLRGWIQGLQSSVDFDSWDGFLTHPGVWGGVIATVVLVAATVFVRGRRDDA